MNEYIISQNCNGVHYAYSRGRFWRWDESAGKRATCWPRSLAKPRPLKSG